jgi:hypothetical protein
LAKELRVGADAQVYLLASGEKTKEIVVNRPQRDFGIDGIEGYNASIRIQVY